MKAKPSNYLLEAVLQAMLAVCTEIKFERKTFKLLIGGSTASNACSMQGYKFESETFKQLIGGSTVSYACSMQGYKYEYWEADTLIMCDTNSFRRAL
mgnify:CR=1 FL=1